MKTQPETELHLRLRKAITVRMEALGFATTDESALSRLTDELDDKYYGLTDSGDDQNAMLFFRQARLVASAGFLQANAFTDAIYEFYHSCETESEAIAGLSNAEQTASAIPQVRARKA